MKTNRTFCFRNVSAFLVLLLALTANIFAQPQYYNFSNGTSYNSFPFNQGAGKMVQTYLAPGEFTTPTPAPNGNITKFHVRISTGYPLGPVTYSNFKIIFIDTTIAGGNMATSFYTSPTADTVLSSASYGPITQAADTWLTFTLQHSHAYNNTRGLIIQIEQTAASGTFAGNFSLQHSVTATNRRLYSAAGAPFTYGGASLYVVNCGIDVAPPATSTPDYLYYKFENNPNSTTVLNCAIPGVGTPSAVLGAGTPLNSGGQFDSCISGTQLTTGGITTGWNCNLGTSSWTISMWLTIPTDPSGSALYLFGDAGSAAFRCFHNGLALPDNLMLRGGFTDITVTGIGPAPTVVTFVYDSAAAQVRAYKNGVLSVTSSQTLNIITGTGFKVGGYGASTSFGGKMDEFRLWRRALTPAEVLAFSTQNLSGCGITGISGNNNEIPNKYSLSQNYPNPFNPTTNITFALPVAGNVELKIYDILGREVATVINTFVTAGTHIVPFDASALATGVYVYKITSGSFTDSKKMMLIK